MIAGWRGEAGRIREEEEEQLGDIKEDTYRVFRNTVHFRRHF
jgi:hypothetical protein